MRNLPLVTVGIPVYNGAEHMTNILRDIYTQDYKNIEIIISDNASTDDSLRVINLAKIENPNLRILTSEKNMGAIQNFNKLFAHANGKYFVIAGIDDTRSSNYISEAVNLLEANEEASLCIPKMNLHTDLDSDEVFSIDLSKTYMPLTPKELYRWSLKSFPSIGFYGVYNIAITKRALPITSCFGGDLIFIQMLSLQGYFVYARNAILNFDMGPNWNSTKSDISFFYGESSPPRFIKPFFVVLIRQIRLILQSKQTFSSKLSLILISLTEEIRRNTLKVLIKLIKRAPLMWKTKKCIMIGLYELFIQPDWIQIRNFDQFCHREIFPRFQ